MSDRLILSRWRRKRTTPFGGEFKYTDAHDLTGDFADPGKSGRYTKGAVKLRWYQKLFRKKPPLAWVVVDEAEVAIPTAAIVPPNKPKVSVLHARALIPVWDERYIMAMDRYEKEHPSV